MAGPSSLTSTPTVTAADMYKRILELEQHIQDLQEEHTTKSKLKIKEPDAFKGEQDKLKAFITQSELYLKYNKVKVECDKILTIATYLKGDAFKWFKPRIQDFLDYDKSDQDRETVHIFKDYNNFVAKLRGIYGDINEEQTAERKLQNLYQKGLATKYTLEF